jgi:hypothetical protein
MQGECLLRTAGGSTSSFGHCLLVEGVGTDYHLLWTLSPDGKRVTWGINTTEAGYVGLGFPLEDSDNVMVGTNAFLLQTCASCSSGPLHITCKQCVAGFFTLLHPTRGHSQLRALGGRSNKHMHAHGSQATAGSPSAQHA